MFEQTVGSFFTVLQAQLPLRDFVKSCVFLSIAAYKVSLPSNIS
jgi:hypothetical protein